MIINDNRLTSNFDKKKEYLNVCFPGKLTFGKKESIYVKSKMIKLWAVESELSDIISD